jgi:hypothetical protein
MAKKIIKGALKSATKTAAKKVLKKRAANVTKKAPKKKVAKKKTGSNPKASKGKKDLMCFLTSACVDFYGLQDNSYELNTLRAFRDDYMSGSETGKHLVEEYYSVAPLIVTKIDNDPNAHLQYRYIYRQVIKACCFIDANKNQAAAAVYVAMVNKLRGRYSL